MNITIENASYQDIVEMFGGPPKTEQDDRVRLINGKKFMVRHYGIEASSYSKNMYSMSLTKLNIDKSKEQLAAEEAVRKAEESLQAAKDTLEKIKENK